MLAALLAPEAPSHWVWDLRGLLSVPALVALNGLFVAAEFALVTARKTRIEGLAADGHAGAIVVRRAMDDPKRFISTCQLGVTMASLGLGWVGMKVGEHREQLTPWFHRADAVIVAAIVAGVAYFVWKQIGSRKQTTRAPDGP